jgi:ribonucleoside-triphosphate reductase
MPGGAAQDPHAPWRRCASIQNVTLNLPRVGYRARNDDAQFFSLLDGLMALAVQAHLQKRAFIEKLLTLGDAGPLAMLAMDGEGGPYLTPGDAVYTIGVVGLNELVQIRTGRQLHESEAALADGLEIVARLREQAERLSARPRHALPAGADPGGDHGLPLRPPRPEALLPPAGRYVRGDLAGGRSTTPTPPSSIPGRPWTRWRGSGWRGRFHPFFRAGAVTHLELGAAEPEARSLAAFLGQAFRETQNNQIVFSPEFTACQHCGTTSRGLLAQCPACGSPSVDGLARISQYVSWVSSWNPGKRPNCGTGAASRALSFLSPREPPPCPPAGRQSRKDRKIGRIGPRRPGHGIYRPLPLTLPGGILILAPFLRACR